MVPHFAEVRLPAKQLKQFSTTRLHFIDVTLDFFSSSIVATLHVNIIILVLVVAALRYLTLQLLRFYNIPTRLTNQLTIKTPTTGAL